MDSHLLLWIAGHPERLSEELRNELRDPANEFVFSAATLPPLHKDPFDRILVAQAMSEDMTLLTADAQLAAYAGPVRKV